MTTQRLARVCQRMWLYFLLAVLWLLHVFCSRLATLIMKISSLSRGILWQSKFN